MCLSILFLSGFISAVCFDVYFDVLSICFVYRSLFAVESMSLGVVSVLSVSAAVVVDVIAVDALVDHDNINNNVNTVTTMILLLLPLMILLIMLKRY